MPAMRRAPAFFLLVLLASTGGCAFDRKWLTLAHETPEPAPAAADPLAGRWEGKWVSEQDGHSGRLRAICTRAAVGGQTYHIEYDAYFLGILRFTHGMNVTATREGDTVKFQGQ